MVAWDPFAFPTSTVAVGTALAGVALFGLAARLPAVFPPAVTRAVGLWAVCAALVPLWVLYESWVPPATVGGSALAAIAVIHLVQTRRAAREVQEDASADDATDESMR